MWNITIIFNDGTAKEIKAVRDTNLDFDNVIVIECETDKGKDKRHIFPLLAVREVIEEKLDE